MSKHSPIPFKAALTVVENAPSTWNIYTPRNGRRFNGDCVAVCDNQHDAEFIVMACNCHDDLLAALKSFLRAPSLGSAGPGSVTIEVQSFNIEAAERAIAKAEGRHAD